MELNAGFVRVKDTAKNKNAVIIHFYDLNYQQQFTTQASTTYNGAYIAAPALNQCFALLAYDDQTVGIQTLDKISFVT